MGGGGSSIGQGSGDEKDGRGRGLGGCRWVEVAERRVGEERGKKDEEVRGKGG